MIIETVNPGAPLPTNGLGDEDSAVSLGKITANLVDTDGSETLKIEIKDIPVGATLLDNTGTHSFTATVGNTVVDVSAWNLNSLSIVPPTNFNGNFTLVVNATATESLNNDSISTSAPLQVVVNPLDDAAVIADPTFHHVIEDTNVDISGDLTATGSISIADPDAAQAGFNTIVTAVGTPLAI